MTTEIALLVGGVLLAIGEFAVWELAILWHSEEKRDPRNMRPPF